MIFQVSSKIIGKSEEAFKLEVGPCSIQGEVKIFFGLGQLGFDWDQALGDALGGDFVEPSVSIESIS